MKLIRKSSDQQVYHHWQSLEQDDIGNLNFGIDLAKNVDWYYAQIEEQDIEKIFIISSDDWKAILEDDYRISNAVKALQKYPDNDKVKNIQIKKDMFKENIDLLERKFIYIAPEQSGNFTIIDGCKRSVALASIDELVGNHIFLGISPQIGSYQWARYSQKSS